MDPVEDDDPLHDGPMREATENDETEYITNTPLRVATENDETESITPDDPRSLHSGWSRELSYEAVLQISSSFHPSQNDLRWSQEVLQAFGNLPDFTPEQAEGLILLAGSYPAGQLWSVRGYMEVFQSQPDHYRLLRDLSQRLKSMARADVVRVMHRQMGALRWLGPVLPEEMQIRDLTPSLWVSLTTALSIPHPQGYNWKWMAAKVHIPSSSIDLWQHKDNPAGDVLRSWQVKREATIGRLFDLLIEQRQDLAAML